MRKLHNVIVFLIGSFILTTCDTIVDPGQISVYSLADLDNPVEGILIAIGRNPTALFRFANSESRQVHCQPAHCLPHKL